MNEDRINQLLQQKEQAYWERNQLLRYFTLLFSSWLEIHPIEDTTWQDEWRNIIFIQFPEGPCSWHIHDNELEFFRHLKFKEGNSWDGSTTEEKYRILRHETMAKEIILTDTTLKKERSC